MSAHDNTLGENLSRMRKARGLTQDALASGAGTHRTVIASLEGGRVTNPGVYTLYSIALVLGEPLERIMGVQAIAETTKGRVRAKAEREENS